MTNQVQTIYPLIKDEDLVGIPAPYTVIIKFLFYTVFAEDYARAGDIKMSRVIKDIVTNPKKVRSPIAKLLLMYEIVYPGKVEYWLNKLPGQIVQNIYNGYKQRSTEYEQFIKESFGETGGRDIPAGSGESRDISEYGTE